MNPKIPMNYDKIEIKSAKKALQYSKKLTTKWSNETLLSQRILIYIAELLENQQRIRRARKLSRWQQHVTKELRAGKTIKEAAKTYVR